MDGRMCDGVTVPDRVYREGVPTNRVVERHIQGGIYPTMVLGGI